MLKSHMDAREHALIAASRIPSSSGHSLHKGTPREAFIREFLQSHLPENVAIGTGEIIDSESKPGASRNQYDIVIYKKSYPKLDFGGGVSGFLIESVIATIEVKSTLTKDGLEQAISAAVACKKLTPSIHTAFHAGYLPPKVLNYVVAYDGPASMATVYGWLVQIHSTLSVLTPKLPLGDERLSVPAPSVDGVFVLGKGFLYFANVPYGHTHEEHHRAQPELRWVYADGLDGNLLLLFLFLQTATSNVEGKWLNPVPYLANTHKDVKTGDL